MIYNEKAPGGLITTSGWRWVITALLVGLLLRTVDYYNIYFTSTVDGYPDVAHTHTQAVLWAFVTTITLITTVVGLVIRKRKVIAIGAACGTAVYGMLLLNVIINISQVDNLIGIRLVGSYLLFFVLWACLLWSQVVLIGVDKRLYLQDNDTGDA